jgi:acid phosphatase family membrane protein YuiD
MAATHTDTKTTSTSVVQDKKLTLGDNGQATSISDITGNAQVHVESVDRQIALASIAAIKSNASDVLQSAGEQTSRSNQIAEKVVSATRDFVESATGQKSSVWIIGLAVGGIVLASFMFNKGK